MIRWMLGWMLDGSWTNFLSILELFWEASWHQVGTKIKKNRVPKRCQQMSGKKVMQTIQRKLERGGGPLRVLRTPTQRVLRTQLDSFQALCTTRVRGRYTYIYIYIYILIYIYVWQHPGPRQMSTVDCQQLISFTWPKA